MSNYESTDVDLAHLDGDYGDTEVKDTDYDAVPPGKYQVVIENVALKYAESSGNPMLTWTLQVISSVCQDQRIWKNSVILPHTLGYLKKDLWRCGVELEKLNDLNNRLNELLDLRLEVTVKAKDGNTNVFFNRLIGTKEDNYQQTASEAKTPF